MKKINKLSIIVPVYNEENTIVKVLNDLIKLDLGNIKKEILVVNDGSRDRTKKLLDKFVKNKEIKILNNETIKVRDFLLEKH